MQIITCSDTDTLYRQPVSLPRRDRRDKTKGEQAEEGLNSASSGFPSPTAHRLGRFAKSNQRNRRIARRLRAPEECTRPTFRIPWECKEYMIKKLEESRLRKAHAASQERPREAEETMHLDSDIFGSAYIELYGSTRSLRTGSSALSEPERNAGSSQPRGILGRANDMAGRTDDPQREAAPDWWTHDAGWQPHMPTPHFMRNLGVVSEEDIALALVRLVAGEQSEGRMTSDDCETTLREAHRWVHAFAAGCITRHS